MDRLRIIKFSTGGRPITQLDINDGTVYSLVRDTLSWQAPAREQKFAQSAHRYGGGQLAAESHQNGQMSAEWYISGGGVANTALTNAGTLFDQLESLEPDRYIEWLP